MSHPGPAKDGFYSIRKHARLMCRFVQTFRHIIIAKYPESTVIGALLTTAVVACEALVEEMDRVQHPGV